MKQYYDQKNKDKQRSTKLYT